jgi:hypothetical protein
MLYTPGANEIAGMAGAKGEGVLTHTNWNPLKIQWNGNCAARQRMYKYILLAARKDELDKQTCYRIPPRNTKSGFFVSVNLSWNF